jgi:hypothetical protein
MEREPALGCDFRAASGKSWLDDGATRTRGLELPHQTGQAAGW